MMKNTSKWIIPAMVVMACSFLPALTWADTLNKPSWSETLKNPESDAARLKKLLDEKNVTGFYEEADKILSKISENNSKRIERSEPQIQSEAEMKDILWVRYLIATAPFVDMESDENVSWVGANGDLDYTDKDMSLWLIGSQGIREPDSEKKFKFKKQEASELYLSSYALVIKQFRDRINPNMATEYEQAKEEALKNQKLLNDQAATIRFFNKLNLKNRRNSSVEFYVERQEESFLFILLKFFPGKAAEIKKYIKMAGYTDEEIPGLIDRTVGRDAETEFLYKGRKEEKPPKSAKKK